MVWDPLQGCDLRSDEAVRKFAFSLPSRAYLLSKIWTLSGAHLECQCSPNLACHADSIIALFHQLFPSAFDRDEPTTGPPSSQALEYLASLRKEREGDEGSSPDERVPSKEAGWRGRGEPMLVGTGYSSREMCDGQSLASPSRWPISARRYCPARNPF